MAMLALCARLGVVAGRDLHLFGLPAPGIAIPLETTRPVSWSTCRRRFDFAHFVMPRPGRDARQNTSVSLHLRPEK